MKQKTRKRKSNRLLTILILLVAICTVYWIAPNYEKIVKNEFTIIYNNEDRTDEITQREKMLSKELYLELQDIKNIFNQDIYIDETNEWIVTVTKNRVVAMNIEKNITEVNSAIIDMNQPVIKEENNYYIPVLELEKIYNVDIKYIEKNNTIVIDLKDKELISADVTKKVKVKDEPKNFTKAIETIKKGESITWISTENGWAKIRSQSGNIGYVKEKNLTNFYTIRENMEQYEVDETLDEDVVNIKELKKIKTIKLDDINSYKKREETIEKIVDQCVLEGVLVLELEDTTLKEKDEITCNRFKQELQARLAEVGIQLK